MILSWRTSCDHRRIASACLGAVAMEQTTLRSMPARSIEARSERRVPSSTAAAAGGTAEFHALTALGASSSGKACV